MAEPDNNEAYFDAIGIACAEELFEFYQPVIDGPTSSAREINKYVRVTKTIRALMRLANKTYRESPDLSDLELVYAEKRLILRESESSSGVQATSGKWLEELYEKASQHHYELTVSGRPHVVDIEAVVAQGDRDWQPARDPYWGFVVGEIVPEVLAHNWKQDQPEREMSVKNAVAITGSEKLGLRLTSMEQVLAEVARQLSRLYNPGVGNPDED